jgi:hypothetical protein
VVPESQALTLPFSTLQQLVLEGVAPGSTAIVRPWSRRRSRAVTLVDDISEINLTAHLPVFRVEVMNGRIVMKYRVYERRLRAQLFSSSFSSF